MQKYFLSVDIGTSSLKVALFYQDSVLISHASKQFSQSSCAYKEWISCFVSCVEDIRHSRVHYQNTTVISSSSHRLKPELYISISGQGPSMVYLNDEDEIIFYSSWDSKNQLPLEGSFSYFLPYVRYVQKHIPKIFSYVKRILAPAEYLIYKLCGKTVICVPHRAYIPYVWGEHDIKRYEFSPSLFPCTVISGSLIGEAITALARNLFLDFERVYIVAGGLDYLSALIGAGIDETTSFVLQRSGTSVVLNAGADAVCKSDSMPAIGYRRFIVPHFFQNKTNIGYSIPFYNDLYVLLREYMHNMQCTSADMMKFCTRSHGVFVTKKLIPHVHSEMPGEVLKRVFHQHGIINAHEKAGYICMTLLREVETVYEHVAHDAALSFGNKKMLAVSGGHASDATLMELYAYMLGKTIRTFSPVFCELRGNLALARFASGAHAHIQDAIQYVQTSFPFRDYKMPKI